MPRRKLPPDKIQYKTDQAETTTSDNGRLQAPHRDIDNYERNNRNYGSKHVIREVNTETKNTKGDLREGTQRELEIGELVRDCECKRTPQESLDDDETNSTRQ